MTTMARRRRVRRVAVPVPDDRREVLRRRARRHARAGDPRKAALALRELVALHEGDAATWAMLGAMLERARRERDAVEAYRQSAWLHRRAGALRRARTVARMIVALDPFDERARSLAAV